MNAWGESAGGHSPSSKRSPVGRALVLAGALIWAAGPTGSALDFPAPAVIAAVALGIALITAGWITHPVRPLRRLAAVAVSTPGLALAAISPALLALLVGVLIGWLLVRRRGLESYASATVVLAAGLLLARIVTAVDEPLWSALAAPLMLLAVLASAAIAAAIDRGVAQRRAHGAERRRRRAAARGALPRDPQRPPSARP